MNRLLFLILGNKDNNSTLSVSSSSSNKLVEKDTPDQDPHPAGVKMTPDDSVPDDEFALAVAQKSLVNNKFKFYPPHVHHITNSHDNLITFNFLYSVTQKH